MNNTHNNKYFVPEELPAPDISAIKHSKKLLDLIKQEIDENQYISFSRYMELALYAPGLGYYSAGSQKLGRGGDFITAPETSSLFSKCLARQCAQVLAELDNKNIIEFGAGSGKMLVDILLELETINCLPDKYYIFDISAELKQRQQENIEKNIPHLAHLVSWLHELPENNFEGIILANEVLDAMPVEKFRIENNCPHDINVTLNENALEFIPGSPCSDNIKNIIDDMHIDLPPGYESEINLAAQSWVHSLGKILSKGIIIIIDYGYPQHEYYHPDRNSGSLMCFYQHHSHTNPLILTGLQDITSHVDFTAIATSATKSGLQVSGYTTQAFFLFGCGIESISTTTDDDDAINQLEINTQIKKLTLPSEMGERFKAMALTKELNIKLIGFSLSDQRAKLLPMK